MPLFARSVADHYPNRDGPAADDYVVLSGGYQAGALHRLTGEDRWAWRVGLGVAVATGTATSPMECRTQIGTAFRDMLARADLRERPDAQPGPPRREHDRPSGPVSQHDRENGPTVRNERRITIRSGELTVGLVSRSTQGPETWSWALTGVPPPDDEDFVWHGDIRSEHDAFDQLEFAWGRWVWWAGLESVTRLQRS